MYDQYAGYMFDGDDDGYRGYDHTDDTNENTQELDCQDGEE